MRKDGRVRGCRSRDTLCCLLPTLLGTRHIHTLHSWGTHTNSCLMHTCVHLCTVAHTDLITLGQVMWMPDAQSLKPVLVSHLSLEGSYPSPTGGLTAPLVVTPWEVHPPPWHECHQRPVWLPYIKCTGHTAPHTYPCTHTGTRAHTRADTGRECRCPSAHTSPRAVTQPIPCRGCS